MIHNYGKVHHNSHPNNDSFILKFFHDDLHNSFVTLRIDASDITFVRSVSSGRIVEMYTVPFTAAVGHGSLTVEVGNTGEVLSEYSVSVTKCTSGLHDIAAKKLSLEPGEVRNTSFTLRSGDTDGGQKECEGKVYVTLFMKVCTYSSAYCCLLVFLMQFSCTIQTSICLTWQRLTSKWVQPACALVSADV